MPDTITVYNASACEEEEAERMTCPRCKGFGANFGDEDGCTLCNEEEEVYRTPRGWTTNLNGENGKLW